KPRFRGLPLPASGLEMTGEGVLFSAEGASRAGLGCCTPPLASNFRSENASTLRAPAIDVAAVVFAEQACPPPRPLSRASSLRCHSEPLAFWPCEESAVAFSRHSPLTTRHCL